LVALDPRLQDLVRTCIGFQFREEAVREPSLSGGVRPLPVGLPGTERRADQDTDAAAQEETHDEIAAVPARRDDGERFHVTERAPAGIATR
jgi:hypothetical protein